MKVILFVCFLIAACMVMKNLSFYYFIAGEIRALRTENIQNTPSYSKRVNIIQTTFEELSSSPSLIILGDSIAFRLAEFAKINLATNSILNGGIAGDTVQNLKTRITTEYLTAKVPVLIIIGTNDVGNNLPEQSFVDELSDIIDIFHNQNLYIVSIINASSWKRDNSKIDCYNEKIRELVNKNSNVSFVDANKLLLTDCSVINDCLIDGIHLNNRGNEILLTEIAYSIGI